MDTKKGDFSVITKIELPPDAAAFARAMASEDGCSEDDVITFLLRKEFRIRQLRQAVQRDREQWTHHCPRSAWDVWVATLPSTMD